MKSMRGSKPFQYVVVNLTIQTYKYKQMVSEIQNINVTL